MCLEILGGVFSLFGGVSGGVCGEVMKKHLTIGKADKQGDVGLFGEVLSYFTMKTYSMEIALLTEITRTGLSDYR